MSNPMLYITFSSSEEIVNHCDFMSQSHKSAKISQIKATTQKFQCCSDLLIDQVTSHKTRTSCD